MKKRKNNNGIFYVVISLVLVFGVGFSIVKAYTGGEPTTVIENQTVEGDYVSSVQPTDVNLAANAGPDSYWDSNIHGYLITGSGSYNNSTTTDADTYTLVTKDIQPYSYLEFDHTGAANITYTLPATSTMMNILPELGSIREWTIHNASTTAVMTIAAGAGMDLVGVDTNVDTIAADGWAELKCMQIDYISATNENIMCSLEEHLDAD